jgi:hypothetical protein
MLDRHCEPNFRTIVDAAQNVRGGRRGPVRHKILLELKCDSTTWPRGLYSTPFVETQNRFSYQKSLVQ